MTMTDGGRMVWEESSDPNAGGNGPKQTNLIDAKDLMKAMTNRLQSFVKKDLEVVSRSRSPVKRDTPGSSVHSKIRTDFVVPGIFVAGYSNPHSQSFCSLAGKSPKIGPCLKRTSVCIAPIHGSRKIFPNWQHYWMLVSEPSPDGFMDLLSAYVPQCWISTSEERGSPGDGPDIGIISEAACS
ncbi:hypothetical protein OUZ56_028004 [Daphnia magna]|uniref:Uncharacterized protein n=1 Tax=Daphnia magna TaxID=35525 RepID=A0ABR0B2K8_9CRUS|nr:hypothetical protein OUZ56_028004 [Daphnia magna]